MWHTDLQTAKDTLCTGWLLFLADKYNCKALCCENWNLTGVLVALRFRAINDGVKKDGKNKVTPVKALHIKIDKVHQTMTRSWIEYLCSSKATIFPLRFKMRLGSARPSIVNKHTGKGKSSKPMITPSQIPWTDGNMLHVGNHNARIN